MKIVNTMLTELLTICTSVIVDFPLCTKSWDAIGGDFLSCPNIMEPNPEESDSFICKLKCLLKFFIAVIKAYPIEFIDTLIKYDIMQSLLCIY